MHVIRHGVQAYPASLDEQEAIVSAILSGRKGSTLILTCHPPVYTIGTSGDRDDVLLREIEGEPIAVFPTGRGGKVTYHGPGQLVCYVIADLRAERDLHRHVWRLEEMVIRSLRGFDITAQRSDRGIGVWVGGKKIASIGVRCRKWIAFHGVSLNVDPNLAHFAGIVPCGMRDAPITSMHALGIDVSRSDVEQVLCLQATDLFARRDYPVV